MGQASRKSVHTDEPDQDSERGVVGEQQHPSSYGQLSIWRRAPHEEPFDPRQLPKYHQCLFSSHGSAKVGCETRSRHSHQAWDAVSMADNLDARLTIPDMTQRRSFILAAALLAVFGIGSLLQSPNPIQILAEGVDITGQVSKVPPLTMQVTGTENPPVLYDDHGGVVPWARESVRESGRWDLAPQILESGTYRVVAGNASAVFAVRAPSTTPPQPNSGIPMMPIAAFSAAAILGVLGCRPRRHASTVALMLAVAAMLPLLPVGTSPAVASDRLAVAAEDPMNDDIAPPLPRDNRSSPPLENDGTILLGAIGPVLRASECVDVDDNTMDLTFLAGGCLAIAFRIAGESGDLDSIAAFWDNPPRTYVNLSLACTVATLDMAADLSRRLSQDALLDGTLNRCDYSYFTGIGAGQSRDAATPNEGFQRSKAYCDAISRGYDDRFTIEIIKDKCHRGIGQSIATRSGGDPDVIIENCGRLIGERVLFPCVDGAFSYIVSLDIERDAHRLDRYWLDPTTTCVHQNVLGSQACARFALNEFYRRGTDLTSRDLAEYCASWGKELTRACAIGLGEVQAVYRDTTGKNLDSAFGLCSISGDEEACLSRWLSTLVVRHDANFVIELCSTLPKRYADTGDGPCRGLDSFLSWLSSKSRFEEPSILPPTPKPAPNPDRATPGSTLAP